MSLTIRPQQGINIDKILGIDIDSDVYNSYIVTNNGESEMYLEFPDPNTLQGIEIVSANGETFSSPISPGGGEYTLVIKVNKDYINSFESEGIFEQLLKIKAVGYDPPTTGTSYEYFILDIEPSEPDPTNPNQRILLLNEYTSIIEIRAVLYGVTENGDREIVLPTDGWNIVPETSTDGSQMRLLSQTPDNNKTQIRFENITPLGLDSTWRFSPIGSQYINAAGNKAAIKVNFRIPTIEDPEGPDTTDDDDIIDGGDTTDDEGQIDDTTSPGGGGSAGGEFTSIQ